MALTNNNVTGVHLPCWDQWPATLPAATVAGSCICTDGKRYIYYLVSATSFWRIDTWCGVHEQLANPTGGTVGAGTTMTYCDTLGKIDSGEIYGSILALITSGTGAPVFNKYDVLTNTWANLNVTNLPGTFGTDGYLCFPEPNDNNYESFHSGAITTVTLTADVALNATTITVSALPKALPANCILNFGTAASPKYVHVTTAAAAAATSLTITASICTVSSGSPALYYDHCYLIGNNATQMYRWQHTTSAWSTTSANSGNPALPAVTAAPGAGCSMRWIPGGGFPTGITTPQDQLVIVRGGASSAIYRFDMNANTMNTLSYNPATETFTTGTSTMVQVVNGKKSKLYLNVNGTQRFFRFNFDKLRKEPVLLEELITPGAALVGDRTCIIKQNGLDILYWLLPTSSYMLRTALWL